MIHIFKMSKLAFIHQFIPLALLIILGFTQSDCGTRVSSRDEWIDPTTGHKVIRLSRRDGENHSFYFHQNIFTKNGDKMLFMGKTNDGISAFSVDMKTYDVQKITKDGVNIANEITAFCPVRREFFYLSGTTLYATQIDSLTTRVVAENLPEDYQHGRGLTFNADETLLVGCYAKGEEKFSEVWKQGKDKYIETVYEAKLPNALYSIDIMTGEVKEFYHVNTWLGHVQFSPTDPTLLEICHEGPEKRLHRMWLIRTDGTGLMKLHKPLSPNEHITHEFWNPDGKSMWFDLRYPGLFLCNVDVTTNETIKYPLNLKIASWHYNISPDGKPFCGDGSHFFAAEHWIYLFTPEDSTMKIDRICDMRKHNYVRAPNTHFTPDGKWVVFTADFGGGSQVYAVEVEKNK